jgi:putative ABC transport system permease protein
VVLFLFFRTNLSTAMRATGNNPQMIRALGVNTRLMIVCGLALANGIIALASALRNTRVLPTSRWDWVCWFGASRA